METGLREKAVLVTGSSQGIGRAIAESFAREGARIALCARNEEQLHTLAATLRKTYNIEAVSFPGDLTKPEDIKRIARETVSAFGTIDVLVNNTGGPPPGFFMDFSDEDWYRAIDLNLMSIIRMLREVIPHMQRRKQGRIINMISVSIKTPIPNLILSNTIRSAIPGLAKTLSEQLAPDNILINNVCPGSTETRRIENLARDLADREHISLEEAKARQAAAIPLGRLAKPEEIAAMAVFLASAGASFITGQTIVVDGGSHRGIY